MEGKVGLGWERRRGYRDGIDGWRKRKGDGRDYDGAKEYERKHHADGTRIRIRARTTRREAETIHGTDIERRGSDSYERDGCDAELEFLEGCARG